MPWRCDSFRLPGNRHSVPGQAWRASARNPILILTVIGEVLLLSFTLTAFWLMAAARITRIQAFMASAGWRVARPAPSEPTALADGLETLCLTKQPRDIMSHRAGRETLCLTGMNKVVQR